jgi:proteasome assembly chaperone (PAC2) family protein
VEPVRWSSQPSLRRPVLVAAFEGWNDAAEAASTAARYLRDAWGGRPFADIDPEEFFDFSATRPHVRLDADGRRQVDWPTNRFWAAPLPGGGNDAMLLVGTEPQLRWRTFCDAVVGVARAHGVELVLTLGALLADVAHTRPVQVTGTADDDGLVSRLGLRRSRYEGPTGIVGVLHDACRQAGLASASLWAAVPHYVAATPSPKAALALVRRAAEVLDVPMAVTDLEAAATSYEEQVSEVVATDEDVAAYVQTLEERGEGLDVDPEAGHSLTAEIEQYLRDHHENGE